MRSRRGAVCCLIGVISTLLAGGCATTLSNWPQVIENPPAPEGLAGLWAGPWREGKRHRGYLTAVITRTSEGEYEVVVRATKTRRSWLNPDEHRPGFNALFRVPLTAVESEHDELRVQGQARQFHQSLGVFTLFVDGTAGEDEIRLGFTRGRTPGELRLRRITPQPMETVSVIPFLLTAQYDSPEMREQVRLAVEMPLDLDSATPSAPDSRILPVSAAE